MQASTALKLPEPMPSPADAPEPRRRDPLRRLLLACALVSAALMLTLGDQADPDLWGHVRYGQDVLAAGHLPATTTYSFTAAGFPWVNHENLAEIVMAFVANHAGGAGLMALTALLGLGTLGLMLAVGRRYASPLVWSLVLPLVAINMSPGWSQRPQLYGFVLFALLVAVLVRTFPEKGRRRPGWLWLAPPLFALWTNTHGGFLAGLGIFVLYLGARGVECLWQERRAALGTAAIYVLVALASCLATLLNPYGVQLLAWLVYDLGIPRPEITEWHSLTLTHPAFIPFALLLGLTVLAWFGRRSRRDVPQAIVLAAAAWQGCSHFRHIPFFAILAGFWLPPQLEALRARWMRRPARSPSADAPSRGGRVLRAAAMVVIAAIVGYRATTLRGLRVDRSTYPVDAFSYMSQHRLIGKLVVNFDWAQYALAAFAPETTVAFDGRFRTAYPQEIADMHFDFLLGNLPGERRRGDLSPPFDDARVLEYGHPDLVLIERAQPHSVEVMAHHPGWVLVYQDAVAQLWGRRDRYGDPVGRDYVPPAQRSITDQPREGFVQWPAFPQPPAARR
jgi:hypothetical protein